MANFFARYNGGIFGGGGGGGGGGTTGDLTDVGTDGIVITGGTGAVNGSGTSIAQHVADSTHNGYLSSADWSTFNAKQSALTLGNLTDAGTDGITVTGGTGAVVGSGTSIAQHVADATHNGYLLNTDWVAFNAKQAAGNYITALTGDVTASGPGSVASTVAKIQSTTVSGTTGSGNVVFSAAPTMTNPVVGTQTQADNSTKAASTAYVDTAIAGKASSTLTSAHIFVGNGSNVATDVAMSGDVGIVNTGATAIAANAVTLAKFVRTGSAGQVLQSNGASSDATYSTPTYPSTSGSVGKILRSDGTNNVYSTATYPTTAGTSGNVLTSDGTNWVSQASSATITNWTAYTPTLSAGWGTTSGLSFFWRQVGDTYEVRGGFTTGTTAASLGTITLPNSATINAAKVTAATASNAVSPVYGTAQTNTSNQYANMVICTSTSTSLVYLGGVISVTGCLAPNNVNNVFASSLFVSVYFSFPS